MFLMLVDTSAALIHFYSTLSKADSQRNTDFGVHYFDFNFFQNMFHAGVDNTFRE